MPELVLRLGLLLGVVQRLDPPILHIDRPVLGGMKACATTWRRNPRAGICVERHAAIETDSCSYNIDEASCPSSYYGSGCFWTNTGDMTSFHCTSTDPCSSNTEVSYIDGELRVEQRNAGMRDGLVQLLHRPSFVPVGWLLLGYFNGRSGLRNCVDGPLLEHHPER